MMRRQHATGQVLWGRRGEIMDIVETIEGEDAPQYFVMGASKVERLGPGAIRVSFYCRHDGINKVEVHLIWEFEQWKRAHEDFRHIYELINRLPVIGGDGRRREMH